MDKNVLWPTEPFPDNNIQHAGFIEGKSEYTATIDIPHDTVCALVCEYQMEVIVVTARIKWRYILPILMQEKSHSENMMQYPVQLTSLPHF